ncbi:UNVERIFIED_ORG: hypothetical protein ABIB52_003753 [Arthrobacter sp. UYCu721]
MLVLNTFGYCHTGSSGCRMADHQSCDQGKVLRRTGVIVRHSSTASASIRPIELLGPTSLRRSTRNPSRFARSRVTPDRSKSDRPSGGRDEQFNPTPSCLRRGHGNRTLARSGVLRFGRWRELPLSSRRECRRARTTGRLTPNGSANSAVQGRMTVSGHAGRRQKSAGYHPPGLRGGSARFGFVAADGQNASSFRVARWREPSVVMDR